MSFSFSRWWAMVLKEFLQLKRDRLTFGMVVGIPLIQLILFGYAISSDPKHMPTAVLAADHSEFTRSFISAMEQSDYFRIVRDLPDEAAAHAALRRGEVMFVLNIPVGFTRALLRGEKPALLLEADATDPVATGTALGSVEQMARAVMRKNIAGTLDFLAPGDLPFQVQVHRMFNPEANSQHNIVPSLMGVILTLTLVLMTGLAITRERERGTMENLLAMPVRPFEVMSGKILPYIFVGLLQATLILLFAILVFRVPFVGSLAMLYLTTLLFAAANLTVGITLSSIARNQLQAMQMSVFYFLPNILLSGFMFPFQGMPGWAQGIGNVLPLTYFIRLVRGIFLKGIGGWDLWPNLWPLLLFTAVIMAVAVKCYRKTLD
ncbi:MAG: ABC transporter permease [Lentisphaerae bacterium]|nr:ABC transporter permease [Lentisphaerota bacterium]